MFAIFGIYFISFTKKQMFFCPGPALALDGLGGPRTKTKFTKWLVTLKRLRIAVLRCPNPEDVSFLQ